MTLPRQGITIKNEVNSVKIILADQSHKEQITILITQLQEQVGLSPSSEAVQESLERLMAQGTPILVALGEKGDVAGVLSLQLRYTLFHSGISALIVDLVVAPSYQGVGVGKSLIEAAVQAAQARKCAVIEVCTAAENRKALAFYSRQGFNQCGLFLEKQLD